MKSFLQNLIISLTLGFSSLNIHHFQNLQLQANQNKVNSNVKHFKKIDDININEAIVTTMLMYNDELFVGTMLDGLFEKNFSDKNFVQVSEIPRNSNIRSITQDNNKNIWLSTQQAGLWEKISGSDQFILIPEMEDKGINLVFCDIEGNLWVGTWDSGLWERNSGSNTFNKNINWISYIISVEAIVEDNLGNLFVGTPGVGVYEKIKGSEEFVQIIDQGISLNAVIKVIYLDKQNNLWVGTKGAGLWEKKSENSNFQQISTVPKEAFISSIFEDINNEIFVTTGNEYKAKSFGIFEKNINNDDFIKINSGLDSDIKMSSLAEDTTNDYLYAGSYNYGVYVYNMKEEPPIPPKNNDNNKLAIEIIIGMACGLIFLVIVFITIDIFTYDKVGIRNFFKKK